MRTIHKLEEMFKIEARPLKGEVALIPLIPELGMEYWFDTAKFSRS